MKVLPFTVKLETATLGSPMTVNDERSKAKKDDVKARLRSEPTTCSTVDYPIIVGMQVSHQREIHYALALHNSYKVTEKTPLLAQLPYTVAFRNVTEFLSIVSLARES